MGGEEAGGAGGGGRIIETEDARGALPRAVRLHREVNVKGEGQMSSLSSLKLVRAGLLVALLLVAALVGVRAVFMVPDSRFNTLLALVLSTLVSGACVVDSKILNRQVVFIAQAALFFLWPFAAPIYLIWSRGWRGVIVLIVCVTILFGTFIAAGAITALVTGRL
jgi:hypothetical protein